MMKIGCKHYNIIKQPHKIDSKYLVVTHKVNEIKEQQKNEHTNECTNSQTWERTWRR